MCSATKPGSFTSERKHGAQLWSQLLQSESQFLGFFILLFSIFAFGEGIYHIIKKIPVEGLGGWDYLIVDEAARQLYVSHGTQVEVLNVDSGAIVGKIPNTLGVHGIALAPEFGCGFVSNGQNSTVTGFDLKTLKTIGEVPTSKKPDGIIYDPAHVTGLCLQRGEVTA